MRSTARCISQSGFALETLQSEPIASTAPAALQRPERVLPAPALAEERDREDVHLVLVRRPERLRVGGHVRASRKRGMSSGWMTWMWAMCGRVSDGPFARRAASTASSDARTAPIADGVEVRLEPERVEGRDPLREPVGVDLQEPAVVGGAAVAVAVRLEHGAR